MVAWPRRPGARVRWRHALQMSLGTCVFILLGGALPGAQATAQSPTDPLADSLAVLEDRVESLRQAPPEVLASAQAELSELYAYLGRHEEALEAGREAAGNLESAGDRTALALVHNRMGLAHWNLVQYDSAVARFTRAQELWTELDDRSSLGRVHNNLGAAHYQWGNYELALSSFLRALEYRREMGQEEGQALALTNVGRTYHDWGQFPRARQAYAEAIRVSDRTNYAFGQAYGRLNLAELYLDEGSLAPARELFLQSLARYGEPDETIPPSDALGGRILNLLGLGAIHISEGELEEGIQLLEETLQVAQNADNPRHMARSRLELGRGLQAAGRYDEASQQLTLGLESARARAQRPIALELLAALSRVEELRGVPTEALAHLQAHMALQDSIFDQGAVQRIAAMEAQDETARQERQNALLREEQRIREAVIRRQQVITVLGGTLLALSALLLGVLVHFYRRGTERQRELAQSNTALETANRDLREALAEVRTLKGLIPICAHCKNVRDDEGYWESVESYIGARSQALFSHSICTECGPRVYGEDWPEPQTASDDSS